MKYIRTKDGIYEEYAREKCPNGCVIATDGTRIPYSSIIKLADTIEELCDEFVYKNGCGNKKDIPMLSKNDFNSLKEWYLGNGYKVNTIYGAIWTNKGLIYVAKLNEKGELELI